MLNPIVFMQGDEGAGRVAEMVRHAIFRYFPTEDVPLTVRARVDSKDLCINNAANKLLQFRSGVKISTATDNEEIEQLKLGSANIKLRNLLNLIGIERMNSLPGRYKHPCGVFRYGSGGIYGEKSCVIETRGEQEIAVITQEMNVSNFKYFAEIAMSIAKEQGLHLVLGTKKTISDSEKIMFNRITRVWNEARLTQGDGQSRNGWLSDWHHQLTDDLMADLPVKNGERKNPFTFGKFLALMNNEKGDDGSDLVDRQDGRRIMTSKLHCLVNGELFSYEELPGGTAKKMAQGVLKGKNFFNPVGMIFAFCNAFEQVNPNLKDFFYTIRLEAMAYLKETKKVQRNTEEMISWISERTQHLLAT